MKTKAATNRKAPGKPRRRNKYRPTWHDVEQVKAELTGQPKQKELSLLNLLEQHRDELRNLAEEYPATESLQVAAAKAAAAVVLWCCGANPARGWKR